MEVITFPQIIEDYLKIYSIFIPKENFVFNLPKKELLSLLEKEGKFEKKVNVLIFYEKEISKLNSPIIIDTFLIKYNKFREEFQFVRIFDVENINFFIDWSYKLLSQQLTEMIMSIGDKAFEYLICELLNKLPKYENISLGKLKSDGGIDFQGYEIIDGNKIEIFGQAKLWKGKVGVPYLRDLVGAIKSKAKSGIQKGVFIATGGFTKTAINYVNNESPIEIDLIDLEQLKTILLLTNIGIQKIPTEMITIDEKYWEEIRYLNH